MKRKFFDTDERGDWQLNTCVGFKPGDAYPYIYGYKQAADRLIQDMAMGERLTVDLVVYPVCFLYRHYLEIHMKDLIRNCGDVYDIAEVEAYLSKTNHSLSDLWAKLKSLLETYDQNDIECFREHDSIIEELDAFDGGGTVFRYNRDLKSKDVSLRHKSTGEPVKHCALDNLYDEMQKIHEILDSASTYLDDLYQGKMEALYDNM